MTFAAEGCYFADYDKVCHSGRPGFYRDTWGEQNMNTSTDELACLNRAVAFWHQCGYRSQKPVTSIYGPTGKLATSRRQQFHVQFSSVQDGI